MSGPHHIVGLSICGPLALTVATAPADRIRLLLQTQDEIVLNLREESMACATSTLLSSSSDPTSSSHNNIQDSTDKREYNVVEEEPRSIITPYAQLPYTDMQDCYQRLLEKEGRKALWRGYSAEVGRMLLQKSVEMRLNRRGTFAIRRWMSLTPPHALQAASGGVGEKGGSAIGWVLATALEGTLVGTVAMAVAYPLSVLHVKMATDVVRRTKAVHTVITKPTVTSTASADTTSPPVEPYTMTSQEAEKKAEGDELIEGSMESISRDSVEWIDHTAEWANANQDQELPTATTPIIDGPPSITETRIITTETTTIETDNDSKKKHSYTYTTFDLSYKYKTFRQILNDIVASPEGYWGLYRGFSTVVAGAFISRLGMITIYSLKALSAGPSNAVIFSPFQMFLTQTALSVVTYPLSTVRHRRMIASPGRYSSSWEAAKEIVERQGWQALFRGVEVVVIRSVILAALSQLLL
ncbi:hypothetical protein FBU30_010589 [Linnemannia zychae]|nr:hypothetical protein FBU30_010589 [Linnemannia zychae]